MPAARSLGEQLAMGAIAGLVAFGLGLAAGPRDVATPRPRTISVLDTANATFELHPGAAKLTVASRDGSFSRDVRLAVVVDGAPHPLTLTRAELRAGPDGLSAALPIPIGNSTVEARILLRADRNRDTVSLGLALPAGADTTGHTLALSAELSSQGEVVFVSGVGQIADRTSVSGSAVLLDSDPHPMAVLSTSGPLKIDAVPEETALPIEPIHLVLGSPEIRANGRAAVDLSFVVATPGAVVWRTIAQLDAIPTARVHGHVSGAPERSLVFGRDAKSSPQVRAHVELGGQFSLEVPRSVVQWYAAVDPGRSSSLVSFVPGSLRDLSLDVSPGGDLHVTISDADTHAPLTARLLLHGVDGTVDPSFGPDYRASGAGPVIDSLRGDVTTPLPSGRYRVAATKGIEWSVDAATVTIVSGRVTEVALAPRHVVPTPGVLACDLHVHARPSFDSPVAPEDRVLSLVAAGIEFAVPTEHNIVGNYAPSIETLDLGRELLSVPGVEVTTYSKGFGHFGVFPYPLGTPVPPYKHTNMAAIFRAVRSGDPNRYFQLNHPRLPGGIGYFYSIGFDPKAPRSHVHNRVDFDGIEIYNGYDNEFPARVDQVLRDYWALLDYGWRYTATGSSDSHRIQYHWAGYPRTMVMIDPSAAASGIDRDDKPIDPLTVVANIKRGHATVTSGPVIEFEVGDSRPGDEIVTTDEVVHGHVRVRAAPWIDVTRVEVVIGEVGGTYRIAESFDIPSRPTKIGAETGTLAEAQDRTIRLDRDLELAMGPANGWVQIVARGERRMDDVLPFVPVPPLGFTNPIYVVRRPAAPPPFPGVP